MTWDVYVYTINGEWIKGNADGLTRDDALAFAEMLDDDLAFLILPCGFSLSADLLAFLL
jgi:hypothetical protein